MWALQKRNEETQEPKTKEATSYESKKIGSAAAGRYVDGGKFDRMLCQRADHLRRRAQATAENGYGLEEFVMVMIPGEDTEKSVQLRDNMAQEMSEAIGVPVTTYRATDYSAAVEAMRTGNAQLAYLGPFSYVTARERAGAECLVVQGQVGNQGRLQILHCGPGGQRYPVSGGPSGQDLCLCGPRVHLWQCDPHR